MQRPPKHKGPNLQGEVQQHMNLGFQGASKVLTLNPLKKKFF